MGPAAWQAGQRSARVAVERAAGKRARAAVLFGGVRGLGRGDRGVVAKRDPQHQCGDREFDRSGENQDPAPGRHRTSMVLLPDARQRHRRPPRPRAGARGGARAARAWWHGASRSRATRRGAYAHEAYWGRPLPGFGDPAARILLSGWLPPRTARTAPGGCSPATAPGTSCSPRCSGRAGEPAALDRGRRRPAVAGRLGQRRGPLRAAREQADAGRAGHVPPRSCARAGAARAVR